MKKLIFLVFLSCFVGMQAVCSTQTQHQAYEGIKVGLVLSGGGAKGMAHIGVLKALDSLGVKIDYIAGTSMGAVIGGLYASGYSGKQLDSIFNSIDFDAIISDNLPRASKTFYERDNSEKYAVTLPFNNFNIQLPSAISKGQNVFNLLSKLTLHVSHIKAFKKLPIPFFCMATNIETGTPVILDSGSLPQAIAASSAFPSLFQPLIINNQILLDGGVTNNYPIDELREKEVDVIIGVDVQDGLVKGYELKSAPKILLQINNFRTINAMKEKSEKTDIYIKPDIKGFSVISFNNGKQIIENGKLAIIKHVNLLKALSRRQKNRHHKIIRVPVVDSIKINTINIQGNIKYTRAYIIGKLKLQRDEKVSYQDFNKGVNNLVATNNFDSFLYEFEPNNDGYNFNINLRESNITTFLKLGIHFDDLYKSAALINLTRKRFLFNNDVASLDLILGDNVRYNFEYYIDKGFYWSIGLRSRYNSFHRNVNAYIFLSPDEIVTTELNKVNVKLADQTNQFFVQTLFRKDLALSLGIEHKNLKITSETFIRDIDLDPDKTIFENGNFLSAFGILKLDTFDNKYFPNKGFLFNVDVHWYFSGLSNNFSQFSTAKANLEYAMSFSDKFSIMIGAQVGFKGKINSDNTSLDFVLGGYGNNFINNYISFYGYDYISIAGDSFIKLSSNLDYEIFNKHHINFSANYANVSRFVLLEDEGVPISEHRGYALGYAFESFIGPIEIKYTWSPETKNSQWFFNLGFWF